MNNQDKLNPDWQRCNKCLGTKNLLKMINHPNGDLETIEIVCDQCEGLGKIKIILDKEGD